MYADQFPHKSLGVHLNLFANKLKVVQHRDPQKNILTLLIMVYMIETKSNNRIYIQ